MLSITSVLLHFPQRPKVCRDLPSVPRSEVRDVLQPQLTRDLPQQREVRPKQVFLGNNVLLWRRNRIKLCLLRPAQIHKHVMFSFFTSTVLLRFPHQAIYQAEGVQQRQAEYLSLLIQHQQLQQHHGRNGGSGRTGHCENKNSLCQSCWI